MDQTQYTMLLDVLAVNPDPRNDRRQRYLWELLRTLLATDEASGQPTIRAIHICEPG